MQKRTTTEREIVRPLFKKKSPKIGGSPKTVYERYWGKTTSRFGVWNPFATKGRVKNEEATQKLSFGAMGVERRKTGKKKTLPPDVRGIRQETVVGGTGEYDDVCGDEK